MSTTNSTIFAATLAMSLLTACAQSAQNHDAHHSEEAAPTQVQAPESAEMGEQAGMAGRDMMAMMSGGDMMPQGGMAGSRGMMMPMNGMMRMSPGVQHLEGRLAFLKAELKITDAQIPQWNAFADEVRANARAMAQMHQKMMSRQAPPKSLPDRLAFEQKAMSAHLDALNKTTAALDELYAALSPEQKKIADQIMVGPMGMPMGMM